MQHRHNQPLHTNHPSDILAFVRIHCMVAQQNDLSLIHSHLFLAFSDCFYFPCEFKISHQVLRHPKKGTRGSYPFFFYFSNSFAFFRPRSDICDSPSPAWKGYRTDKKDLREEESPLEGRFNGIDLLHGSLAQPQNGTREDRECTSTGPSAMEKKGYPTTRERGFFLFYGMALKEGRWSLTSVWYDEAGLLFTTAVKRLHNSFERWMRDDEAKRSKAKHTRGDHEGIDGTSSRGKDIWYCHVPSLWNSRRRLVPLRYLRPDPPSCV
jgi:hypothetical protein